MLPILISNGTNIGLVLKIVAIKIVIGMIAGLLVDFVFRKKKKNVEDIHDLCEHEHCHCEEGIIKSSIKHTIQIFAFILIVSVILNLILHVIGKDTLAELVLNKPILGPILAGIIGLIPNCASSVILTQLYLSGVLSLAVMIGGLLVNAGVGLLVLFKVNQHPKQNIKIVLTLYAIGTISAMVLQLFEMKGLL